MNLLRKGLSSSSLPRSGAAGSGSLPHSQTHTPSHTYTHTPPTHVHARTHSHTHTHACTHGLKPRSTASFHQLFLSSRSSVQLPSLSHFILTFPQRFYEWKPPLRTPFSVQSSHSAVSSSRPHGPQNARPPCPSPTPGVY